MAAGNFEKCLPIILQFEGGRSNDPADPGGRTNKGITQRTYNAYRARLKKPSNDVYAIADAEVADCYRRDYWDAVDGDSIPPGEDLAIFDFAVNSGPARAVRVRGMASQANLKADANIRNICANRLAFMQSLPTWPHFGSGWARRVAEVQKHGLAMAAGKPAVPSKAKPGHAGGAVVVAGGMLAGLAHWFGTPLHLTLVIAFGFCAIAVFAWLAETRARQTAAAKAHAPPAPTPMSPTDDIEAALAKVAEAKIALAAAVANVHQMRDKIVKQAADLQAEAHDAETRLDAIAADVSADSPSVPAQEQSDHMEAVLK
jgi:lysozyme family protein